MATTTYAAIRASQVSTIEALTPTSHAQVPFRHSREEQPLISWAEENPEAAFRRFSLLDSLEYEGPEVSNADQEYVRTTAVLMLCYPQTFGKYGSLNMPDLLRVIEEDIFKIDTAIGHRSQTTPADWLCQKRAAPDVSFEGVNVLGATLGPRDIAVVRMRYEVGFYRAM